MISIIIILKNETGIVDTIKSLDALEYVGEKEIIIVDRSTINYPQIENRTDLVWLKFDPKGKRYTIPEQRNAGVKMSQGEIVVFIDASCIANKNWLSELLKPIQLEGEYFVMGETGSTGGKTIYDLTATTLKGIRYVNEAPTINLAIRKEVFNKIGYFDTNFDYGSDSDFTWRAIDAGYKIRFQSSAVCYHDWGDTIKNTHRSFIYGKGRAKLLIKHRKTRWRRLFGNDAVVVLYPVLILFLPLAIVFPFYLLVFPFLVLKNYKSPKPFNLVYNHLIYGCGVLNELMNYMKLRNVKNN